MAPPTRDKKRGVPKTLDPKSRVQKSMNNTERTQPLAEALNRSVEKIITVAKQTAAVQDTQVVASSEQTIGLTMDRYDESDHESVIEDFPPLPSIPSLKRPFESQATVEDTREANTPHKYDSPEQNSKLMTKARGLLNLVGPYLEDMEIECPGSGTDFLALISDGVSRAIRGEKIYTNIDVLLRNASTTPTNNNRNTWAARAAGGNNLSINNSVWGPPAKPSNPPRGQSHEDRRIMIRLGHDHEARKAEPFLLRQQIQSLIPDPSLVSDAWQAPSGIAILAPTPAKAATLLQYKDVIAQRYGNAVVERQESWTTFIVGPLPKHVTTMQGAKDPLDGLLLEEPGIARIRDEVPIRQIAWTKKSVESTDLTGYIRVHVPEHKAHKFPSRLQLFGIAVGIQRIRDRKPVPTCLKCHGFHATRTCARKFMCKLCGKEKHEGECSLPRQCLNCLGPHDSLSVFCPARPQRKNGAIVRMSGTQLRHIRKAGHRSFLKVHCEPESLRAEEAASDSNSTSH